MGSGYDNRARTRERYKRFTMLAVVGSGCVAHVCRERYRHHRTGFNCHVRALSDQTASDDLVDVEASGHVCGEQCRICLCLNDNHAPNKKNAECAGFLRDSHIRRHLLVLGGVPRWVVEFLLGLKKCTQPDDSSESRNITVKVN